MSQFDEWKAAIGIGAARLVMNLPVRQYSQGALVQGILTLTGGAVEQHVDQVVVLLEQWQHQGKSSTSQILVTVPVVFSLTVAPHARYELPFQFFLPDSAALSRDTLGYRLRAHACIALAIDPRANPIALTVTPHHALMAVRTALLRLGFVEKPAPFWAGSISQEPRWTYAVPSLLQEALDEIVFEGNVTDGWMNGRLTLNRREQSAADYLRAMTGGDKETFVIQIPAYELLDGQGMPNSEGAIMPLRQILDKALALPGGEQDWLLRASSAPIPAEETLLRPATSHNTEMHPKELLRVPDSEAPESIEPH